MRYALRRERVDGRIQQAVRQAQTGARHEQQVGSQVGGHERDQAVQHERGERNAPSAPSVGERAQTETDGERGQRVADEKGAHFARAL